MPCRDELAEEDERRELLRRHQNVTQMLCSVCKIMDARGILLPAKVHKWWEAHKEFDRRKK